MPSKTMNEESVGVGVNDVDVGNDGYYCQWRRRQATASMLLMVIRDSNKLNDVENIIR